MDIKEQIHGLTEEMLTKMCIRDRDYVNALDTHGEDGLGESFLPEVSRAFTLSLIHI